MSDYELNRLSRMILLAQQLGYADDVAHWKAERERLVADRAAGRADE